MYHCEFPFNFYLVADLECFLRLPSDDDDESNVDAFHVPSGFCVFRVTDHGRIVPTPLCIRVTT